MIVDWRESLGKGKIHLSAKVSLIFNILIPEPKTRLEEQTLDWFFNLDEEAKLAQLTLRYKDWSRDQQRAYERVEG